jgi:hypothetical protein
MPLPSSHADLTCGWLFDFRTGGEIVMACVNVSVGRIWPPLILSDKYWIAA